MNVFPGAARCDVDRFSTQTAQPAPEPIGDHFRTIVRTYVLRNTVGLHQVGKDINRILAPDTACHMDGQAFPGIFIDDDHQLDRPTIHRTIKYEVPGPDMIAMLWPQADAGTVIQPQSATLGLLLGHFKALTPPDAHHPAMADLPALRSEQSMDPAVTVPPILARKPQDICCQGFLILTRLRDVAYRVTGNAQRLADAPL